MQLEYKEWPVAFSLSGYDLYGVFSEPRKSFNTALVIVVGGPQYRVGSHRQFVLLARFLAARGILVLRFDYSGMGYSAGPEKEFYEIDEDIGAAIDLVYSRYPQVENLFVWGLCDAATAAAYYSFTDSRISGLILLNPWVRSDETHSKVLLTNYYQDRLFSLQVWKELLCSPKKIFNAIISLTHVVLSVIKTMLFRKSTKRDFEISHEERKNEIASALFKALTHYSGQICLIISGNDLTANEFEQALKSSQWLATPKNADKTLIYRIDGADHTFSSAVWRSQVEEFTWKFMQQT